ncbi:uroporphyrinogen-III synthase [Roseobacter sinensis]|uniref:Uroporphyrinogen-III synthase n=1 Tax=Roseobacter sinensis TaxID=2931391 RepID=A0ABT3B8S7_9RHOB|nr:uroporphyrinogen-III synthase [Roseobacter sp. WL0113]MCV3269975.1 uroporphyrinogen-III synthase [Roseobacter sp. WL0113]
MGTPPLSLILTRPTRANQRFADQLPGALRDRVRIILSPLIEIVPVEAALTIAPEDAVIFTSANAVRFAPRGAGRRAFCVGAATTEAARSAGWQATFSGQTADALVASLGSELPTSPLWHLAGRYTRGQVAERLSAQGLSVQRRTVYDQALLSLTAEARACLAGSDPVIVAVFSPRTAMGFARDCPVTAHPSVAALSVAVAEPLAHLPLKALEIAEEPTAEAMVRCLEKLVARVSLG